MRYGPAPEIHIRLIFEFPTVNTLWAGGFPGFSLTNLTIKAPIVLFTAFLFIAPIHSLKSSLRCEGAFMGSSLFSAAYAAQAAEVNRELLESWLKNGVFETEHFAKNSKTQERTFYFAPTDVNRLAEFAARETRKTRASNGRGPENAREA
jgi:hypothetical protein